MNTEQPSILTSAFALLSIRRVIAALCVLAILSQALVGASDVYDNDADAGHQQMLDLSYAMGEASHDCHNSSHYHGCVPVFGLSVEMPAVLLDPQHDFVATNSNILPRYSPSIPFRPPIV